MKKITLLVLFVIAGLNTLAVQSPTPSITNIYPRSGIIGSQVTITGTNFSTSTLSNIVRFGATTAHVVLASETQLVVEVPFGGTYQSVSVTTNGYTAYSESPFMIIVNCASKISANTFGAEVSLTSAEDESYFTAVGDLDGDGFSELAVANYSGSTISIFLNSGSTGVTTEASFSARVDLTVGSRPSGITFGDLDSDGKLDIAVSNQISNTISIFRNVSTTGSLSFDLGLELIATNGPAGIYIHDLDLDGKPEIVVANNGGNSSSGANSVSVFQNQTTTGLITEEAFQNRVDFFTGDNPLGMNVADLNNDGKPEIVVANSNSSTVSILENTSVPGVLDANSFSNKINLPSLSSPENQVTIGDLNGDHKPDLAVVSLLNGKVSVYENGYTGGSLEVSTFSNRVDFNTDSRPLSVIFDDPDSDGNLDMIVVHEGTGTIYVYPNKGFNGPISASTFAPQIVFQKSGYSFNSSMGDLNNDGKPELIVGQGSNHVSILPNINPTTPVSIIKSVVIPASPFRVNTSVSITVHYSGEGPADAIIDWNDGTTNTITATDTVFTASHTYSKSGIFTANVTLQDACGSNVTTTSGPLICFDPEGGFAIGAGWITSPPGSFPKNPSLSGKATFEFASKYIANGNVPAGLALFEFRVGRMMFLSASFQWMVISEHKSYIKGVGSVNGRGTFDFVLTAIDGDRKNPASSDMLRIRITDRLTNEVVYDNQTGSPEFSEAAAALGGGRIIIYDRNPLMENASAGNDLMSLYPNPASSYIFIDILLPQMNKAVQVTILDKVGLPVKQQTFISSGELLSVDVRQLPGGTYYAVVNTYAGVRTIRFVKE